MEKLVGFIYKKIRQYNPMLNLLPVEDVKQEIRIAVWQAQPGNQFKAASKNINRLAAEFGYSRKRGKDNFQLFYEQRNPSETQNETLLFIETFYREHTARETATLFQIPFTPRLTKLLHNAFPKNAGWGGKRKNSGNKKKHENSN